MHRSLLVLLLCGAAASNAVAQNPPPAPPAPAAAAAPDPFTGQVALGYLSTTGNTDSTNGNASFGMKYALPKWEHEVKASAVAATTDEVTSAEAYTAKYTARRGFGDNKKSYLFTTLDWRKDRFSSYEDELSETAGYGRRLIDRAPHLLTGEIGAGARQADLIDGTSEDEAIIRGALAYTWQFTETTGFSQDLVIESGSSNTSTEWISKLRAKLVGNIGLVLSYRLKHNSQVVLGSEPTDTFTSISLEYAF
jgi:putative salt-induced outer membrane protein